MRLLWILLASLIAACSSGPGSGRPTIDAEQAVPLRTVRFSGNRYVAPADLGLGRTTPLMVHGNARMFLMVTHDVGERLNRGPVRKIEEYGYSSRGKGILQVASLQLGEERFTRIPPVPVFDFTEAGDTVVQGMLGVPFLVAARAAVDFTRDRLLLGAAVRPEPDRRLMARGYSCVPITIGPTHRVTLDARFPAIGRAVPVTPSTVSTAVTLHTPLFAGRVPMTKAPSPDRSPSGTTPDVFVCDQIHFEIGGIPMHSPASFEDLAEYGKVSEQELESFGQLGFDWMKAHRAILDYANRRLYFMP